MAERRPPYAPEYRLQMVELVRASRTPGELAREFECSAQAVRNWVRQADRDEGRREDGLTSTEREELRLGEEHPSARRAGGQGSGARGQPAEIDLCPGSVADLGRRQ